MNVYETVKELKGHIIIRKIGSHGPYHVMVREYGYVTFETLKAAVEYIKNEL